MHIVESQSHFLVVSNEAIPELMLPNASFALPTPIEFAARDILDVFHHAGNGYRKPWPNKCVPVIRHQHVTTE